MIIERSRMDTVDKFQRYFIDKYQLPVNARGKADGYYAAYSVPDDFGYVHGITIEVRNGRVVNVNYDERKNGHSKTADSAYCADMNAHVAGSAPKLTYPRYEQQLIDKQNLLKMDAISGATYSLYRFRHVASEALAGNPEDSTAIAEERRRNDLISEAVTYQHKLNEEFADPKLSPLTPEDRKTFTGLDFYPVNTGLIFDVQIHRTPQATPFMMKRTKDEVKYVKYGDVQFEYQGKKHKLNLYQNLDLIARDPAYKNHLFMPFTDLTNGNGSYGGGRYIDLEIPEGDHLVIDFNRAYNPYCAYNKKYSCPIPPAENDLNMTVKAGVKAYKGH